MEELHEKLREQGIEKLADVKAAYLEGDGQISVIRNCRVAAPKPLRRSFRQREAAACVANAVRRYRMPVEVRPRLRVASMHLGSTARAHRHAIAR